MVLLSGNMTRSNVSKIADSLVLLSMDEMGRLPPSAKSAPLPTLERKTKAGNTYAAPLEL